MRPLFLITIGAIIILGLGIRFYNWGNYPFGFDQVQILENAQRIQKGFLTLIGPRTGPATFFTGPLIYYLTALWPPFLYPPHSLLAINLVIISVTGLTLVYLEKRYVRDHGHLLVILSLWAVSSLIVSMDRIVWNPNLSLLASLLSYYPLMHLIKKVKPTALDYVCLGAGGFLGYQAHFTGLLIPFIVTFLWVVLIRKHVLIPAASWLGLVLSVVPTIIFDLRHQWLNRTGLLELMNNATVVNTTLRDSSSFKNLFITAENMGKLMFDYRSSSIIVVLGIMIILSYLFLASKASKNKIKLYSVPILWLFGVIVLFSLYQKDKPEYYFILQIPPLLHMAATTITRLYRYHKILGLALIAAVLTTSLRANYYHSTEIGKLNFIDQLTTSQYLHQQSQRQPIRQFIYQMPHASSIGLEYLLKDINLQPQGNIITVIYPIQSYESYTQTFGLLGIRQ